MNLQSAENKKYLIVIAGPTAAGKTKVALQIAEVFDAEIFSADSRQIYREMSIGTAKPPEAELKNVKHHFIDQISVHDPYSVGKFEKEAIGLLNTYFKSNQCAVLCGGTGLYIKAILEGLDDFPDVSEDILQYYNLKFETEGLKSLQEELLANDPDHYHTADIYNHRRIIRALSVIKQSGKAYSLYLSKSEKAVRNFEPIEILLKVPREELYLRINSRVDHMISTGLLSEVQSLLPYQHLKALQTVGYQELFDYFNQKIHFETAVELIKRNSRRYAKRQMTWFSKYGNWSKFAPTEIELIVAHIQNVLDQGTY